MQENEQWGIRLFKHLRGVLESLDVDRDQSLLYLRAIYCVAFFQMADRIIVSGKSWTLFRPDKMVQIWDLIRFAPFPEFEIFLMAAGPVVTLLTAVFVESRALRVATFIFFLLISGRSSQADLVDHNPHFLIALLFFLCLIPGDSWKKFAQKKAWICTAIHAGGIALALNLTFAGIYKVGYGLYELVNFSQGIFSSPHSFGWIIASELPQLQSGLTSFGTWLLHNPYIAYPMLLTGIAFECGTVYLAFRPKFHRALAVAGIAFFAGTGLAMDTIFPGAAYALLTAFMLNPLRERNA